MRNRFRSTAAHNPLLIDGAEQNHIDAGPSGLFILGNEAAVSSIQHGKEAQGYFLRASHTGYYSLGVKQTRTVHAIKNERSFVIKDEHECDGVHYIMLRLHLSLNRYEHFPPSY